MDNSTLRRIFVVVTLLVGNSVFMVLLGPSPFYDTTYDAVINALGRFLGMFICEVGEGRYIIISYAIIIFIAFKLFPLPKSDEAKDD
jgi:hypothetical protein